MNGPIALRFVGLVSLVFGLIACEPELDLPWFVEVDAWCEETDPEASEDPLIFDIWARLDHDRGPAAVDDVWVEVSLVEYDNVDSTVYLTPVAGFDLLPLEEEGDWHVGVESGQTAVDCVYPFEYHFLFSAQDDDGDIVRADFIN